MRHVTKAVALSAMLAVAMPAAAQCTGASFLKTTRLGIGLDIVLEGGGVNGKRVGGLQLLASPGFLS